MKTNREQEIYVERSFKPNNSTIQNLMDIERFILPHTSTSGVARLKMRVISWVGLQFYNY
ncbi:qua-quine starch [Arabidopsis thaliana]|uniref:Protein QUA-QUINE STARCH n=2 Tax=Arabidopsis thaliana TaxID=3702 RepID=QQS_ARATH|nr:qua-quine starch [Arabidopsis thaliana]Q3E7K4.1 RecName: Full=Protein QQS; AltName: Full=Qua-quine starch [Arabidopsis thaliana]ACE80938.1 qua-quine starch [Arabidopsis thaliana]AEE77653.1 qua-quine starch [Arabidopsis thaliana]|eukprot:NP_189695.1 qua-quine starch [Arabidopsis thaliana]